MQEFLASNTLQCILTVQATESCLELRSVIHAHGLQLMCKEVDKAMNYVQGSQDPYVAGQGCMDASVILFHAIAEAEALWPAGLPGDVVRCCTNVARKFRDILVAEVLSVTGEDRDMFLNHVNEIWPLDDALPLEFRAQLLLAYHKPR